MEAKKKHPGGRPSGYSLELAKRICDRIATTDLGLAAICAQSDDFPEPSTFRDWVRQREEVSVLYARAKEQQAQLLVEQIIEISDDATRDRVMTPDGLRVDHDHIQRSRLRVDSRKWLASKLLPRLYGDRTAVDVGGQADNQLIVSWMDATDKSK